MLTRRSLVLSSAAALAACAELPTNGSAAAREASDLAVLPPAAPREFRAAWVATVANIDWPSKKGLSMEQQQAEARAMLDKAVALKFNAIVFQIRTAADALYDSRLEPWSEYLTGTQGQSPGYDPLAFWVAEAHARGLELHAWFNPFRARQNSAKSAAAATHLSQSKPQWVKSYGDQLWIDPGEIEAGEHTLAVFKDVLKRYDVDGLHIDDYFYPYPIALPGRAADSKEELDFPDEPSWQRYVQAGGTLARNDWRRQNVDRLIERIYGMIRATKPWVRFGVSPFGIPKPSVRNENITGFSQYDKLYAHVELWLNEGWMDYLVPQLYWSRTQKGQSFEPLMEAWLSNNPMKRHVWPGLFTSRIQNDKPETWGPDEITGQIEIVRRRAPGSGHVHFSMVALTQNRKGLAEVLQGGLYKDAVLVPATPWLETGAPAAPTLSVERQGAQVMLKPAPGAGSKPVSRYAIWLRVDGQWRFEVTTGALGVPAAGLDAVVVSALDRVSNESERRGYRL